MLRRKIFALLLVTCLIVTMFAVPGALAADAFTATGGNDQITVTGTADTIGTVQLWVDGAPQGTQTIANAGDSFSFSIPASEGEHLVQVAYTPGDAPLGDVQTITVTTASAPPPVTAIAITASAAAGKINVSAVTKAHAGREVRLWVDGAIVATKPADGGTITFEIPASVGNHDVQADYDDGQGASNLATVSVPQEATAITITKATPTYGKITVTGTAQSGASVTLWMDGAAVETKAATDGSFTFEAAAAAGTHTVQVAYGDNSGASGVETVTVPSAIDITISSVALIGRNQLRVIGRAAPGARVKLDVPGGTSKEITISNSDGTFNEVISNLPTGTFTSINASYIGTNTAYGNGTSFAGSWKVEAASTADITITGFKADIGRVTITGKAKANTQVRAYVGSDTGTATTDANGNYSITITLAAGTYSGAEVRYTTTGIGNNASIDDKIVVPASSTSTPPPSGTYQTLSRGMINSYVTTLQQWLKALGYYTIRVDGIFGVGTQTAVRNFQIMNGLSATGVADDAMQRLLYSGTAIGIGGGSVTPPTPGSYATLRYGSRGTAVRNLQVRLANLRYYYGAIDGIYGSQTEAAVRNFQSRNNLSASGIAYSATQTAAYSSSAISNNSNSSTGYVYLHYGSRGTAVTRLQTALKNLGYYKGALDGQYYDQTYAAVKSFQRANGLVVDGIAGKKTQNKLYGTNY